MLEDLELQKQLNDAITFSHLYHQQHLIDEFPIDYAEFRRRIDPYDIPTVMTTFADELAKPEYAESVIYLQRALDLINNPPA
jgi:hypothetical protein